MTKLITFIQSQLKKDLPDIRPGDVVRVYQKIPALLTQTRNTKKGKSETAVSPKEEEKIQIFEGLVLAKKHIKGISGMITVRKVIKGIGVERIFPIHSPNIKKIEIVKRGKVRRAKLYYLRKAKGKRALLKQKGFVGVITEEKLPIEGKTEIAKKPQKVEKIEENKKEKK